MRAMTHASMTTASGLTVLAARHPGVEGMAISVAVRCGMVDERPGEAGYAHLLEHLVHQHTGAPGAARLEQAIHAVGGISNAQTYPFHTEYSLHVPLFPSSTQEISQWITGSLGRLTWPRLPRGAIGAEQLIVEREVDLGVNGRPLGGFPWRHLLGTISREFGFAHDGFGDLNDVRSATVTSLRSFFSRHYHPSKAAISIVTDRDPDEILETFDRTAESRSASTVPKALPVTSAVLEINRTDPLFSGWVRAESRLLSGTGNPTVDRAAALVACRVASLLDPTVRWQGGLFGPELGPDHDLVVSIGSGRGKAGLLTTPTPQPDSPDYSALVQRGTRDVLDALDRHQSSPATYSAMLTRDALWGFPPGATRAAVAATSPAAVSDLLGLISATAPGCLTVCGTAPVEPQRAATSVPA